MKVVLRNRSLLVKRDEAAAETEAGIIIPQAVRERMNSGRVVAVSEDTRGELPIGTHVLFGEYAGIELELENVTVVLLDSNDILLILNAENGTDIGAPAPADATAEAQVANASA